MKPWNPFSRKKPTANATVFESPMFKAAAATPQTTLPVKPPKPGGLSLPGYRLTSTPTAARIPLKAFDVTNVDLAATYRNGATSIQVVRDLSRINPEMSGSKTANSRVGIPEKYIMIARNPDNTFNRDATQLALQLAAQMETTPDYINGFSHISSLRSVSEALAREMQETGAMAMELILDKTRLPSRFQPIATTQLQFFDQKEGPQPQQLIGGQLIPLDTPTFFYAAVDPSILDIYPQSPLESAIQPVLASTSFLQDMRRLCSSQIYKRYDLSINEEKLRERIPMEILNDQEALTNYLNGVMAEVEAAVSNLGVDEALVHYDFFEVQYIANDTQDAGGTFDTVNSIYSGKVATGTKTPPSILGMGSTTQNLASTETLMFMINANGLVRLKLQEIYSKAFTLAVRLFGLDVMVEFEFDDIDLRPQAELESYKLMKQERLLNLLSLGMLTDDEVCLRLTGQLTPAGYTPLMGTGFKDAAATGVDVTPNDGSQVSQTSNIKKTPTAPKGPVKKGAK